MKGDNKKELTARCPDEKILVTPTTAAGGGTHCERGGEGWEEPMSKANPLLRVFAIEQLLWGGSAQRSQNPLLKKESTRGRKQDIGRGNRPGVSESANRKMGDCLQKKVRAAKVKTKRKRQAVQERGRPFEQKASKQLRKENRDYQGGTEIIGRTGRALAGKGNGDPFDDEKETSTGKTTPRARGEKNAICAKKRMTTGQNGRRRNRGGERGSGPIVGVRERKNAVKAIKKKGMKTPIEKDIKRAAGGGDRELGKKGTKKACVLEGPPLNRGKIVKKGGRTRKHGKLCLGRGEANKGLPGKPLKESGKRRGMREAVFWHRIEGRSIKRGAWT